MKKLFAFVLTLAVLLTLLACHPTTGNDPLGTGLTPIVTHPSDTAGQNPTDGTDGTQVPSIPYETMPTDQGTMPSNPGDNVPVPEDPTTPEDNKNQ